MVMGIAGIPRYPRVYRDNGVKHGGNTVGMELEIAVTAGMELAVMVLPRNWGHPLRLFPLLTVLQANGQLYGRSVNGLLFLHRLQ